MTSVYISEVEQIFPIHIGIHQTHRDNDQWQLVQVQNDAEFSSGLTDSKSPFLPGQFNALHLGD